MLIILFTNIFLIYFFKDLKLLNEFQKKNIFIVEELFIFEKDFIYEKEIEIKKIFKEFHFLTSTLNFLHFSDCSLNGCFNRKHILKNVKKKNILKKTNNNLLIFFS